MNTTHIPVCIVGGGPTGLTAAHQMERFNIPYILIESDSTTVTESRAMVMHARTLEFMAQIGLAQELIEAGQRATKAALFDDGTPKAELNFSEVPVELTPYPYMLCIEQNKTEEILLHNLQKKDSLWFETTVTEVFSRKEYVEILYTNNAGQQGVIRAEYVLACDGAHSTVRRELQLQFKGKRYSQSFLVMDALIDGGHDNEGIILGNKLNTLSLSFSLKEPNKYRFFISLPKVNDTNNVNEALANVKNYLPFDPLTMEPIWFSYYKVSCKILEKFSHGRVVFMGDSAHTHSPVGGQGMNTGIGDAVNWGWKLHEVYHHGSAPQLLTTYDSERMRFAKGLLSTTDKLFTFLMTKGTLSKILFWLFSNVFFNFVSRTRSIRIWLFKRISQISLNHFESRLSDGHVGDLRGGQRLPLFNYMIQDGHYTTSFDSMKISAFVIFVFTKEGEVPIDIRAMMPRDVNSVPNIIYIDDPFVRKQFSLPRGTFITVRPDLYISKVGICK